MTSVAVHLAKEEADFDAARRLCRDWVDWQLTTFPELRDRILTKFEPVAYAAVLRDLPVIHARPKGAIFLATLDGRPEGTASYTEMEPGVAEIHRLFVADAGRGHGLGRLLLNTMFDQMRTDGYGTVRFSSARFLTHARALYESVGFHDIPHLPGFPKEMRDFVYFMEQRL